MLRQLEFKSPGTPLKLFLILLSILYSITFISLVILGENRIDAYISLYILIYFILYSVLSPIGVRADRLLTKLSYILFSIFIIIVSYRILLILGYI